MSRPKGKQDEGNRKPRSEWTNNEVLTLLSSLHKEYPVLIKLLNKSESAIKSKMRELGVTRLVWLGHHYHSGALYSNNEFIYSSVKKQGCFLTFSTDERLWLRIKKSLIELKRYNPSGYNAFIRDGESCSENLKV